MKKTRVPLCMQSTITWHKYPDEKPTESTKVLVLGENTITIGRFFEDPNEEGHWRNESLDYEMDGVNYWSYMPEGPIKDDLRTHAGGYITL